VLFSTLTAAGRPAAQLRAALLAEDQIGRPAAGPIGSFRRLDGGPAPGGREIA
jgi:hypothetical protein